MIDEEPDYWVSALLGTAPGCPYVIYRDDESEA